MTATISPSKSEYLFGNQDVDIQFENYQDTDGCQIVKSTSILQLVERLTWPK